MHTGVGWLPLRICDTVHSITACCLISSPAGKAIYLLPARARTSSFVTTKRAPTGVTLANNVADNVHDQLSGIVHQELDAAAAGELSPVTPPPYVPKNSKEERV